MPNYPLSCIVVRWNTRVTDKHKELLEECDCAGSKRTHGSFCFYPRHAQCSQLIFILFLLVYTLLCLYAKWETLVRTDVLFCILIERVNLCCPSMQPFVFGIFLSDSMDIPKVMDLTALMKSGVGIVCGIKIRREYSIKRISQYFLDYLSASAFLYIR